MPRPKRHALTVIDEAVQRYEEQQDRYRKLVEHVGESLQQELSKRGILSTVQWRAKSPQSLRRKLHKREFLLSMESPADALAAVRDLAAVRVCTYRDADRANALEAVRELFIIDPGSVIVKDTDRAQRSDTSRWYRATHLQLSLDPGKLTEQLYNARSDTCELQICSLLQHAFNEVEHDIAYKPVVRPPARVVELLHRFGEWRETGDRLIDEILEADEEFRKSLLERVIDDYDAFVADVADRLPIDVEDDKLPDLHLALVSVGISHSRDLWGGVRLEDFYVADELIREICRALEQAHRILGPRGFAPLLMDINSTADRLLVALLPKFGTALSRSTVSRLTTISNAYLALTESRASP
jgi:ppGpp synthetase/RelA/SpoT-type nucleotidyltranferase